MDILKTDLPGVFIVEPRVFKDDRGYFYESFSQREFDEKLLPALFGPDSRRRLTFVQDNQSASVYGVVRGLHYQKPPFTQSKLVRCVVGRVLDVAVDIRKGSPTYRRHVAVELSADNHRQLFIPKGFAHGFSVLSPTAVFQYKCDEFYHPEADAGILLSDPAIGIDWKVPASDMILSAKDMGRAPLDDDAPDFDFFTDLYDRG